MTLRLDLRKRPNLAHPGQAWRDRPVLAAEPFGCADCGQWFAFATGPAGLVAHLREHAHDAIDAAAQPVEALLATGEFADLLDGDGDPKSDAHQAATTIGEAATAPRPAGDLLDGDRDA